MLANDRQRLNLHTVQTSLKIGEAVTLSRPRPSRRPVASSARRLRRLPPDILSALRALRVDLRLVGEDALAKNKLQDRFAGEVAPRLALLKNQPLHVGSIFLIARIVSAFRLERRLVRRV